ncbi:hypothetical protein SAMCFNEI73_Ch2751 [Sinorhizobium americanum]|uniref:Uncharacterized protein n=1 Tax=Sinorhizobium americanum TaxID=194963 RepID=A0A1L3LPQ6_9HYPH|nr:hypothetical protein SAMCCGM7_Ch2629 [Sinorhizobium americanum CCGM7]APG92026.1 hypothetical protein SAMCFNEI73_Ch2751 [Sinorhizobium americanum]
MSSSNYHSDHGASAKMQVASGERVRGQPRTLEPDQLLI